MTELPRQGEGPIEDPVTVKVTREQLLSGEPYMPAWITGPVVKDDQDEQAEPEG